MSATLKKRLLEVYIDDIEYFSVTVCPSIAKLTRQSYNSG